MWVLCTMETVGLYFSYSAWRNRILYKVNIQDCTKSRGASSCALGTRSYNLLASILTTSDVHVFFKWKKSTRVQMLKKSQGKRVNTEFFVLWSALKGTGTVKSRRTRIHIVFYSVYGSSPLPSSPIWLHHTRHCNMIFTGQHEPLGV